MVLIPGDGINKTFGPWLHQTGTG